MSESLVQQVIAEVLRQQGGSNKKNNSNINTIISSSSNKNNNSNSNKNNNSNNGNRSQLTEQLLTNILGDTSPKDRTGSGKQTKFVHQEINVGKGKEELVGFAPGGTVGIVIPNLDTQIRKLMNFTESRRAIGIISSRVGSAPQIFAVDDAVKKTNSIVEKIQLARDGQGGPGHGVYIILASNDVADVQRAVEISLANVEDYFVQEDQLDIGKVEAHYTARAAEALAEVYNAKPNRAFGLIGGSPAGIGLLMSDAAVKTALIEATYYVGPSVESAFTNEVWLGFTGESAAVKNGIEVAKEVGSKLLSDYSQQLGR